MKKIMLFIVCLFSISSFANSSNIDVEIIDILNKNKEVNDLGCKGYSSLLPIRKPSKYMTGTINIVVVKPLLKKIPFIDSGTLECEVFESGDRHAAERLIRVVAKEKGIINENEYSIYHGSITTGSQSISGGFGKWSFSCKKDVFTDDEACSFNPSDYIGMPVVFVFVKNGSGYALNVGANDADNGIAMIKFGSDAPIKSGNNQLFSEEDTSVIIDNINENKDFIVRYTRKNGTNSDSQVFLTPLKDAKVFFEKIFNAF